MKQTITGINPKNSSLLTGKEKYPIIGNKIAEEKIRDITSRFYGLRRYWHCLEKAQIAKKIIGFGDIVIGSLMLLDKDTNSTFGYYYNPPLEFHAWLEFNDGLYILDLALPGVIEHGSELKDEYGPFLTNREPVILNGVPEEWMIYKKFQTIK